MSCKINPATAAVPFSPDHSLPEPLVKDGRKWVLSAECHSAPLHLSSSTAFFPRLCWVCWLLRKREDELRQLDRDFHFPKSVGFNHKKKWEEKKHRKSDLGSYRTKIGEGSIVMRLHCLFLSLTFAIYRWSVRYACICGLHCSSCNIYMGIRQRH